MGLRYGYLRTVLSSSTHRLRAMEQHDIELLWQWENASDDWWMGATNAPISREAMSRFVNGQHDLFADGQLRFMLDHCFQDQWSTVGAVDLYDFVPRQRRAGVATHIDVAHRRQGHASSGIQLLCQYAKSHLGLRQLYAEIPAGHTPSLKAFLSAQFVETGRRKEWSMTPHGDWVDVLTLQRLFGHSQSDNAKP